MKNKLITFAQEAKPVLSPGMLTRTPYETREDLDILFENSIQVLDYLEGEELKQPIFLAIMTATQKNTVFNAGLQPQVLDSEVDLSRYIYFSSFEPDQSKMLSYLGEVLPITSYHTLVKLPLGVLYSQDERTTYFTVMPLVKKVVTPPFRTKKVPSPTPNLEITLIPPLEKPLQPYTAGIGVIIFVIIVVVLFFILKFVKKKV